MPWALGVYTRGYPSWSNDAASNLPISSSKFDLEDNDFASGLNNCLTKDGLNVPTGTLNWSQTAAVVMNLTRGSDGTIATFGRTGGSNNPSLQVVNADATGISLNLSTSQQLSLAIAGTAVLALAAATATLNPSTSGTLGLAAVPVIGWLAGNVNLFNNVVASTATLFVNNTSTVATQDAKVQLAAGTTSLFFYSANQNRATAVITNGPTGAQSAIYTGGLIPLVFGINSQEVCRVTTLGQWIWDAPTATGSSAFTFNGINGNNTMNVVAGAGAGGAFGLNILGGTTTADYALNVKNQANSATYFQVQGDGQIFMIPPTAASISASVFQIGYLDVPANAQTISYQLVLADRGRDIYYTGAGGVTLTIPANSVTAFPVGSVVNITNDTGGNISIALATDTLLWTPSGTVASPRTLASRGTCLLRKVTTTRWWISGVGIT